MLNEIASKFKWFAVSTYKYIRHLHTLGRCWDNYQVCFTSRMFHLPSCLNKNLPSCLYKNLPTSTTPISYLAKKITVNQLNECFICQLSEYKSAQLLVQKSAHFNYTNLLPSEKNHSKPTKWSFDYWIYLNLSQLLKLLNEIAANTYSDTMLYLQYYNIVRNAKRNS